MDTCVKKQLNSNVTATSSGSLQSVDALSWHQLDPRSDKTNKKFRGLNLKVAPSTIMETNSEHDNDEPVLKEPLSATKTSSPSKNEDTAPEPQACLEPEDDDAIMDEEHDSQEESSPVTATNSSSSSTKSNEEDAAAKAEAIFNSKIAFPLNLTRMLEAADGMGKLHIIHWSEDGLSFIVCNIDAFLADMLPKFFKSSENTKIRSFYRKLNRWGFSMSRKNANNPNNVWHHPEFHRDSAKAALKLAMDTGKATDFLNMSSISRGKKRRVTDGSKDDCLLDDDDTHTTQTTFDNSSIRDFSDSDFNSLLNPSFSRSSLQSSGSWIGGTNGMMLGNINSMPILPSSKTSMDNLNKRWKLGHSFTAGTPNRQPIPQDPGQGGRRVLSHNYTSAGSTGIRRTQSSMPATNGRMNSSVSTNNFSNSTFESMGEGSVINPTFDLSAMSNPSPPPNVLQENQLAGMMAYSFTNSSSANKPRPNFFNLSAREMLSTRGLNSSTSDANPFGLTLGRDGTSSNTPFCRGDLASNSDGAGITKTPEINNSTPNILGHAPTTQVVKSRQELEREMTRKEDDELTAFLGNFATRLPPPQEDDEEEGCLGEPDPLRDF